MGALARMRGRFRFRPARLQERLANSEMLTRQGKAPAAKKGASRDTVRNDT
jgi:hypothetical protein